EGVLGQAGAVDRAEEGGLHGEDVVRGRLAEVVLPGPEELALAELPVAVLLQRVLAAERPRSQVVVVGGCRPLAGGVVLAGVEQVRVLVDAARRGLRR